MNKTFVKAHQRAYKCYLSLGDLERALESLNQAKALGDSTAGQQLQTVKTVRVYLREYSEYLVGRYGEID